MAATENGSTVTCSKEPRSLSYLDGLRVMAILLLVAIPFVWIMKKPEFKSHPQEQTE